MNAAILVLLGALTGPTLSLEQALSTAETQSPQLRQARGSTEVAEARGQEVSAPMLPQVTATGSYKRSTSNTAPNPGVTSNRAGSNSFDTTGLYSVGVTASLLLYDFGQTSGRVDAQKATIEAQRQSAEAMKLQVLYNTRLSFFTARAQREMVQVSERSVANQKRHLEQITAFVEVKTRPEIDLAQARLDTANAELQLINAQNGYAVAKAQLNQVMGVIQGTDYEVADQGSAVVMGEESPTDALVQEAVQRADLVAIRKQLEAQRLSIRATKGAYGPTVSASTALTDSGVQLNNMAWNWNAMVSVSWPIFQGNVTNAQVRGGEASLTVIQAQLQVLEQQIRLSIEQAKLSIRATKAASAVADVAIQNAQIRLELAEGRYKAGVGNMIELGDAQLAFSSAEAQKVQAEYNLATARAQLLQALGRR